METKDTFFFSHTSAKNVLLGSEGMEEAAAETQNSKFQKSQIMLVQKCSFWANLENPYPCTLDVFKHK